MKNGFTLIELLASITILLIIVMMIANVIGRTAKIWTRGTDQIQTSDVGRNAIGLMQRDSNVAIADENFPFLRLENEYTWNGSQNDALYIVSSVAKRTANTDNKDWKEVCYFVATDTRGRNALVRREANSTVGAYLNTYNSISALNGKIGGWRTHPTDPFLSCEVVVDDIYSFKVNCYDNGGTAISGDYYSIANNGKVPAYVEVELVTLSDENWAVTNWMTNPADFDKYAKENGERFTATLGFPLCER